ncbi:TonB-dependent receptor [Sphingomonas crocodyli]|uniref:TonB-dependent receptor n=1 Tax=Sphingomonas crocodyli TaxID=1979270 RepID=A0A437LZV1_9SPHN|nr:TonB-dependent receptor [Sphingomonas crocodyli]RVT90961.1 TonB-dependent receptor [Sphingomonas crocodyli]
MTTDRISKAVTRPSLLAAVSLLTLSIPATPVFAQDAPDSTAASTGGALEDIVVTARSRDEDLFEAPLSITSLSSADLERANVQDIAAVAQLSPGFYYTQQASFSSTRAAPSFRFRGMNNDTNDAIQQLGGTFVDGVYLLGGASSLTFDDIERVEVIKGPQSALFGRGTFSGAINFITREPSSHFSARASAGVETKGTRNFSLSAEGPITEGLYFRISGANNVKGAHFHTADGGDLGREETKAVNAQLLFKPNDNFRVRIRHSEVWQDDSRSAVVFMNASSPLLANAPNRCTTGTQPYFCGSVPNLGSRGVPNAVYSVATSLLPPAFARSNNPNILVDILNNNRSNPLVRNGLPYLDQTPSLNHAGLAGRFTRTSGEVGYKFDGGTSIDLVVSDSEARSTSAQTTSGDAGNAWVISPAILRDRSADLRISSNPSHRFTWLVGANAFRQKSLGGSAGTGAIPSTLDSTRVVAYNEPTVFNNQSMLKSKSLFGALGYEILDGLSLDVEGRYVIDKLTTSLGLATQTERTFKNFVPRAILTWQPVEDLTLYTSWARGALPGTTNSSFPLYSAAIQAQVNAIPGFSVNVADEKIDNYELGVKQKLGWFRYAITGYQMKWKNLKNAVNIPCPGNVCGPTIFGAFAGVTIGQSAKIKGIEVEMDAQLATGWTASISGSYTDAKYDRYFAPLAAAATGQTNASGKTIRGFPSVQGVFTTGYTMPVAGGWDGFINTDAAYTGKIYVDEINQSWIKPWVKWNLRVGGTRDGIRVEAYVENLLNNKTWLSGLRSTQSVYSIGTTSVSQVVATTVLPRLRTFGVRASYKFD